MSPLFAKALRLAALFMGGAFLHTTDVLAANVELISGTYSVTPSADGSTATINAAGIRNTTTDMISGSLGLELWYLAKPYSGGSVTGYKVAALYLPVGQCTTSTLQVDRSCTGIQVSTSLTLPPAGTYYPVLFLVEYSSTCTANSGYCIADYSALDNVRTGGPTVTVGTGTGSTPSSSGVSIVGSYSLISLSQSTVQVSVARIQNNSATRTTGPLRLELWLTTSPYAGGTLTGHRVGTYQITGSSNGTLGPQQYFPNVATTMSLTNLPTAGSYYPILLVTEFSSTCTEGDGFCIATYGGFSDPFIVGTSTGTASSISLAGGYSYDVDFSTSTLKLNVSKLQNGSTLRTTRRLRLELWLTSKAYAGGDILGNRIGSYLFTGTSSGTLGPSQSFSNVSVTVPMANLPSPGSYFATLVVTELSQNCGSQDGFCIATYGSFGGAFTVPAPVATSTSAGDDGGGGAFDWLGIAALIAALGWRFRVSASHDRAGTRTFSSLTRSDAQRYFR